MTYLKNVLEVVNEVVVIPIAIITFILLMYMVIYLNRKDPDIIRSKIFLKYREFKNAFILLAVFAFVLILHVLFIYVPHFYLFDDYFLIRDLQQIFGLILALTMITFVGSIFRSMK